MLQWVTSSLLGLLAVGALGQPILVGMTGPLLLEIGRQTAAGLSFALEEANQAGGILGRNLTLLARDDGYNATRAMDNIVTLVDSDNCLLLASVVGSDVALQAKPFILQRGVPAVGVVTGSLSLRDPFHREYVHVRASYADEVVAQAKALVAHLHAQRIACLYQADSFGLQGLTSLTAALANVRMRLVGAASYGWNIADIARAVDAIAGAVLPPQAVVLVASQDAALPFIRLYMNDSRTDPGCVFLVMSAGWGSAYRTQLDRALWGQVFFFFVVPLPGDPNWAIARHFSAAFTGAGFVADPPALEGYITGRLIVDVLQRTRSANPTRAMFLDEVYNDRLFVLDDLVVGMYSTNYSGCEQALCSCNAGLRSVFSAQLDPTTGILGPSLGEVRYSVLQCRSSEAAVVAPLLFGQAVPAGDAGWKAVALDIGRGIARAFDDANAAGGAGGRNFSLVQQNYASNASHAMQQLSNRYRLAALLGGVVPTTAGLQMPLPSLGTFETLAAAADPAFAREEVRLQPSTALEVMALADWAAPLCPALHLRTPASAAGQALLDLLIKSVHSFQRKPTSTSTYSSATDVLATTHSGCVLALGSDVDVLSWFAALPAYPALQLLTLSGPVMRLLALTPNASSLGHASRLHFPTIVAGGGNGTDLPPHPGEAWAYGYVLGQAVVQAVLHSAYASASYTSPEELLNAWYTVRVMTAGGVTLGPYSDEACADGDPGCECNAGVRTLAVRTVASPAPQSQYSIATCHVVYTPLQESVDTDWIVPTSVGTVVGIVCCGVVGLAVYLRLTRRSHSAAPKDPTKPFCVLFTDIQASTHLWATVPDVMAPALSAHHELIRKALAKHRCYEVKTIGDSFMAAAHSPLQAVRLALAVQTALHEYDWGTDAIDAAYRDLLTLGDPAPVPRGGGPGHCWKGLRVRIGIHYGMGDIQFDPVSQGYDYYGMVVNTAARIEGVCHGGQVGVSHPVYAAVHRELPDVAWADLGCHELRGLGEAVHLYQALPAGPLAARTFPPLRLDKAALRDFSYDVDVEVSGALASCDSSRPSALAKPNSVVPSDSHGSTVDTFAWVETHPLVLHGDVAPDDLRRFYAVAAATLATLLNTQAEKFRQDTVRGLCERLHVPNHGAHGAALQRTLRGLVLRVLPATVVTAQQQLQKCLTRHNSKSSSALSTSVPLRMSSFQCS